MAPERTTLTDRLKARFNSRTEPKELYLFVSGKAKISATGPEMPIHECMATWTRHWEESNYASTVCKNYQGPHTVKRIYEVEAVFIAQGLHDRKRFPSPALHWVYSLVKEKKLVIVHSYNSGELRLKSFLYQVYYSLYD